MYVSPSAWSMPTSSSDFTRWCGRAIGNSFAGQGRVLGCTRSETSIRSCRTTSIHSNLREDHREERNLAERESARMDELLSLLSSEEAHSDDPEWGLTEEERKVLGWGNES